MKNRRLSIIGALAKGLAVAVGVTLAGMLLMAGAVVFIGLSDTLIRVLDQALKLCAVALGTFAAVGRGGQRGLVTGAGLGAGYAVIGYVLYVLLGGNGFDIVELMGEITICVAAGAVMGAICANLSPKRARARA